MDSESRHLRLGLLLGLLLVAAVWVTFVTGRRDHAWLAPPPPAAHTRPVLPALEPTAEDLLAELERDPTTRNWKFIANTCLHLAQRDGGPLQIHPEQMERWLPHVRRTEDPRYRWYLLTLLGERGPAMPQPVLAEFEEELTEIQRTQAGGGKKQDGLGRELTMIPDDAAHILAMLLIRYDSSVAKEWLSDFLLPEKRPWQPDPALAYWEKLKDRVAAKMKGRYPVRVVNETDELQALPAGTVISVSPECSVLTLSPAGQMVSVVRTGGAVNAGCFAMGSRYKGPEDGVFLEAAPSVAYLLLRCDGRTTVAELERFCGEDPRQRERLVLALLLFSQCSLLDLRGAPGDSAPVKDLERVAPPTLAPSDDFRVYRIFWIVHLE